jgi:hypothetical protein
VGPPQEDSQHRRAARETLRDELREVVGEDAAAAGERAGALEAAESAGRPRTVTAALSQSRILIGVTFFLALIVGAVGGLASGQWWWLAVALLLHALGTTVVVATTLRMTADVESPDPRAAAALEEHGIRDPEAALNEAVRVTADATDDPRRAPTARDRPRG